MRTKYFNEVMHYPAKIYYLRGDGLLGKLS
jgi:hypothetical protein